MSTESKAPAVPRVAASVLLVREHPLEVLMVRRAAGGTFSSALVFPGGTIDEDDHADHWEQLLHGADGLEPVERALRIAALRETFEEIGVLLLVDPEGNELPADACDPASPFIEAVRASGGLLPLSRLVPFAHWITPEAAPKRFDTRFYLIAAPGEARPVCDGAETVEVRWESPHSLASEEAGLPFPTRLNLMRLAEHHTVGEALAAAQERPHFTVLPRVEKREDGIYVVIPTESGYAQTEERREGGRLT